MTTATDDRLTAVLLQSLDKLEQLEDSRRHPGLFLQHVQALDNTTGEHFRFRFSDEQIERWRRVEFKPGQPYDPLITREEIERRLKPPALDWSWQGDILDFWLLEDITINLKARQLGLTWCDCGLNLWLNVFHPGLRIIVQSKNEDDAADYVDHVWEMWESLSDRENFDTGEREDFSHLRNDVKTIKPGRPGVRPYLDVEWQHPDGRVSQLNAMASTAGAGHGRTAFRVTLDEFSRHPYAREAFKATIPTQAGSKKVSGKTNLISTGNGVSNQQDGGGNFFHHVWVTAEEKGIAKVFLRWDMNPDRDDDWYLRVPMKLDAKDRGEQYPNDEFEAFILTGDVYYDPEILEWYRRYRLREPVRRFNFEEIPPEQPGQPIKARVVERSDGWVRIFVEPKSSSRYVIFADVASGKGLDASCAQLLDLDTMELAAQIHSSRIGASDYAKHLHYLGRMYGNARIAVESAGGWGEPVIIFLHDGKDGRPPYPHLYRHRIEDDPEKPQVSTYGFPMNTKTRPLVIEGLGRALMDKSLPWLDGETLSELLTFVHRDTNPSPRASEGTRDDRVTSLAGVVELWRQRGVNPRRIKRKMRKPPKQLNPW